MIVGRERELAELREFLGRPTPGMALVVGEAGIGKTALIEALTAADHDDALVARCREGTAAAFDPLIELTRQAGHLADPTRPSVVDDSRTAPVALLESALLTREPRAKVAILEDIHWASPDTIDLLPLLTERLAAGGVPLVATCRAPLPRGHRVRWLRSELRRARLLHECVLTPLTTADLERLLPMIAPMAAPAEIATIIERSRGVPFYAIELARALAERGDQPYRLPETVRDLIAVSLAALPERVRAAVRCAAAIGTDCAIDLLADLGVDPDDLLESGLVDESGDDTLTFRHAIVTEAVRVETPWRERHRLHRAIADALETRGAHPRLVADHLLNAGAQEDAASRFAEAARRLEAAGAYRDAAEAAAAALRLATVAGTAVAGPSGWTRSDLLRRKARCEELSGELGAAAQTLAELVELPAVAGDPQRLAEAARALASVQGMLADEHAAFRAREREAEAWRALGRDAELAATLLQQLPLLVGGMRFTDAVTVAGEAATLARGARRADLEARALGLQAHVMAMAGRAPEARVVAESAFELALRHELSAVSAETYRRLGGVLEYSSDFGGALEIYESAVEQCRRAGAQEAACDAMGCMCYTLYRSGDWTRSLEFARGVLTNPAAPAMSRATALMTIATIRTMRGEVRRARRAIEEAEQYASARGFIVYLLLTRAPRAAMLDIEGAPEAALAEYRSLLVDADELVDRHDVLPGLTHAAGFFAEVGAEAELAAEIDYVNRVAVETGNPEAIATLATAHGAMSALAGRHAEALERYLDAARRYRELGIPLEQAHATFRAALAARAGGNPRAPALFEEAAAIARRLGARALLVLIERAGGADQAGDGGGALSPRQREVAALLVEGLSNKEIAAQLYLSTRTVEMHVAHICDRLNCRGRTQAVARLLELRGDGGDGNNASRPDGAPPLP